MTVKTPHLLLPVQLDATGAFAVVEQGDPQEIAQCVEAVLRTPLGHWDESSLTDADRTLDELGMPDETFVEGGGDPELAETQLASFEPRAEVLVDEAPDLLDAAVSVVGVSLLG